MTWADALPNLLIGLREGLEAGVVVSILFAALQQTNSSSDDRGLRTSSAPIWLGVLGAVMLSGSFAAVLTYSTSALSSNAQEAAGGLLSVLAVALVTAMVFWMRRAARTLSAQLRGEVARASMIGAGALTLTAFLAVGREGLETTLFLWTAVKASGSTASPLVGAAIGLLAAVVLCWLLYQRAIRINLGAFFSRTAVALIVIAAGVLSYGLGDLQDAGWLPGQRWIAFDLTAHIDPNSWWVSIISGVTDLAPKMSVLQVTAWLTYLAVVVPAFVLAGRTPNRSVAPASTEPASTAAYLSRWERLAARRAASLAAVLIMLPALAAGLTIIALPTTHASAIETVTITKSDCANQWSNGHTGTQTFEVVNRSGQAGEINLDDAAGSVVAEIETIGPATTVDMTTTLGAGSYTFVCLMSKHTTRGALVQVSGAQHATPTPVTPVTLNDLTGPNNQYQTYAAAELVTLAHDVSALWSDLVADQLSAAKTQWLTAQLDWERVGASYDSFGSEGEAVDGLPDGLSGGVNDPNFTGLHRIEYGLYHGQSAAELVPVAAELTKDVATVQQKLTTGDEAGDPTQLPLRVHEILEDALRDHLSGIDDEGAGAAYAETYADTQVDRVVLGEVTPLITTRIPTLTAAITAQLNSLQSALLGTQVDRQWVDPATVPLASRQRVDAAIGALLESLSIEPDLLEVPPTH